MNDTTKEEYQKMDRKDRIEEVGKYIDSHFIPDQYDDIVLDQEMSGIFDRISEFRRKRLESGAEDAAPKKCFSEPEPPALTKDEEMSPELDESYSIGNNAAKPMYGNMAANRCLDDLMSQLDETFTERLLRMIDERNRSEAEVYKKAYVDRRHFSKIKKDKNYSPKKKTVFAFAIALELSIDETKDLLGSAGYALSRSSRFDIIVAYFLQNRIYDMFEINDVLYAYEQPVFE